MNAGSIPETEYRAELDKVLSSHTFTRAAQLRTLLGYLAENSIGGRGQEITEKEVAEKVLRLVDFNPETDSLVRKEMSRLRDKLSRYYLSEGLANELRLEARGGYAITFRPTGAPGRSDKRCWLVLPFRSSSELIAYADEILDELYMELNQEGRLEVVAPTTSLTYRGRFGDVRQFAVECAADYIVEGSLKVRDGIAETMIWLVEGKTGKCGLSFRTSGRDPAEVAKSASGWLLKGIDSTVR